MRKKVGHSTVWALIALLTLSPHAYAQALETIPEAIARGASGRTRTIPSGVQPTLGDVIKTTTVVVRGIVGEPRSYLSHDQRNVYTEYAIIEPVVLYDSEVRASMRPGVVPGITVRQLGGTIVWNGRKFTQTEEALPPLMPGQEVLLLLERTGDEYHIAGTFYGAFRVAGGRLFPLTRKQGFAPRYQDAPVAPAIDEILSELHKLAR